jgi:anti-anti-sigma factor
MIDYISKDDCLIFRFTGKMDTKNSLNFEQDIYHKAEEAPDKLFIFDLQEVDYIASAFLRICITVAQKAPKDGFEIINVQPQIKKIFKIAGLEQYFPIS